MSTKKLPVWPAVSISTEDETGLPHLEWRAVKGASGYEIYRSARKNGKFTKMWTVKEPSYTNTSAKPGVTYYYQVKPLGLDEAEISNVVYITCDCAQPVVQVGIEPVSGQPELTWEKVPGAKKYEIYRSTRSNGKYVRLWTQIDNVYHNTTAQAGKTYYYRVKALCANSHYGNSALSEKVYITCDCAMPTVVLGHDEANDCPVMTWEAVPGAKAYEIYRSATEKGTYMRVWTTENTNYHPPETFKGTTYYRVRALCGPSKYGNGENSVPVAVTIE